MNQLCKVCGEPAAGFHFGAFTCEGCKSFFGRSYNNLSSISECKNNGKCIIDKKNRTTCKACRLRKCYMVGMSKSGSRYGRRSNWFKIHCLLQEQQQQQQQQQPQHAQQNQQSTTTASMDNNNVKNFMGGVMGMGYPGMAGYAAPAFAPPAQPAAHAHNQAELMAAAMPFFRLMHSTEALSHGHFALPPTQLLFCPEAMAAYHQRRSVDSSNSSESPRRFSPYVTTAQTRLTATPNTVQSNVTRAQTPELCVYSSADEDEDEHLSVSCNSPLPTPTLNAVTPPISQNSPAPASLFISHVFPSPVSSVNLTQSPKTLAPPTNINTDACDNTTLDERLSFSHKIQSLSPVSVCSISAEYQSSHTSSASTAAVTASTAATELYEYQEAPIDLSMKTSTSVNKKHASPVPAEQQPAVEQQHHHFASPVEDNCSSHANSTPELAENGSEQQSEFGQLSDNNKHAFSGFTPLNNTSLRGIFVCV